MREPFLFRFKQVCESPDRSEWDASYSYDPGLDMIIDTGTTPNVPAIVSPRRPGPPTKKKDLEKGEDQKDFRMWQ